MKSLHVTGWLGAGLLLVCSGVSADTDQPPVIVSPDGVDAGNCRATESPCRTIDYALLRIVKNGLMDVEPGDYTLQAAENVVYLTSDAIDVHAHDGATLIGIHPDFAADLEARGFRVIVDSKGIEGEQLAATQENLKSNTPATPCFNGTAGSFPCSNVDLLAHVADRAAAARGADIWGFMDLNSNREYAIMGYSNGVALYNVTDPRNPREVGFVSGQSTTWRDIKVYQYRDEAFGRWRAFAYVTSDDTTEGLFVIDLSALPQHVSRVPYASDFASAHNVFVTGIDYATGLPLGDAPPLLIVAGSNVTDGRFRSYSLANPESPTFVASPATPVDQPAGNRLYIHDAASMAVTDSRKDTQCVNASAASSCRVLFDFNESSVDVWDTTVPADPLRLSRTPYANSGYTHSGWPSEDGQYLFVQDELDERDYGMNTTLRVFSVADLTAPTLVGAWTGPTRAIDHNGFVRGSRYYMSNYARGLTVLDISDPATPIIAGYFDTYPASDAVGFPGAWGTYPYLPSGTVAVSDIDSGLYLLEDRTLDVPAGSISFASTVFGGDEGGTAQIILRRLGGIAGPVTVDWEVIAASGSLDDVTVSQGTVDWADGDGADKTVDIGLIDDGLAETAERLLVRLKSPAGGAALATPAMTSLYISETGATATIGFDGAAIVADEGDFGMAVAVVQRTGSASGPASVDFLVSGGDAAAGTDFTGPTSGTLSWDDGDADPRWIEYSISDDGIEEGTEFFELSLSNAAGATIGTPDTLRIDIADNDVAPPPSPPQPTSGGGAPAPMLVVVLLMGVMRRWLSRTGGS